MNVENKCKISAQYLQNYEGWAKRTQGHGCEHNNNIFVCILCYLISVFASGSSTLLDVVSNDPDRYYSHDVTPSTMSITARTVARNACRACQQCNNPPARLPIVPIGPVGPIRPA